MKKIFFSVAFLFLFFFFGTLEVKASTCSGSVTCESDCVSIRVPGSCSPSGCDPLDSYCQECTGYERNCNYHQEACGFAHVWNGTCAADCSSVGGSYSSGSCSSSTTGGTSTPTPTATPMCTVASSWSAWGACSVSCGGGVQTRYNTCSGATESTVCNTQACPPPSCDTHPQDYWSSWSNCSASCGPGTQTRSNSCTKATETQNCNLRTCEPQCTWGGWSSCDNSCGNGKQYRHDNCNNTDEKSCYSDVGCVSCTAAWTSWSICSTACNGTQYRNSVCGGAVVATESRACNVNAPACNVPTVTNTQTPAVCNNMTVTDYNKNVYISVEPGPGGRTYLIPNKSFEDGTTSLWVTSNQLSFANAFDCFSNPAFSCPFDGSWFMAMKRDASVHDDPYLASGWFNAGLGDLSGKTFEFSFDARGEFVNYPITYIGLQTRARDDDWTNGTSVYTSLPAVNVTPQVWQRYTYTVTFPSAPAGSSTAEMRIVLRTPQNDYTAYYDNIQIKNVTAVSQVRFFYTPYQQYNPNYCNVQWTEIQNVTSWGPPMTATETWYATWDTTGLPNGNAYYIAANVVDNGGNSCTGNPSGTCGTGYTGQCGGCRAVYTICTESCTPACGQANGCGGTCPTTDAGVPTAPTITSPANNANVSMTSTTIIINFNQSSTAHTNKYELLLFNKGFYDSIINAPDGGFDVNGDGVINYDDLKAYAIAYPEDERVKYSQQTGNYYQTPGAYSDSFWMTANVDMNRNLVAAVRAVNTTCSTQQPSAWGVSQFNLVGSVTGGLYEVTSVNDCSTTSKPATMTMPSVVSITDTFGVNHTINSWLVNYNLFRITNLPYAPTNWPATWSSARLAVNNDPAHPENTYICATCNRNPVGTVLDCVYPPQTGGTTTVPMSGANFFLISYNLSNGPWWQTWGGLVLANGNMSSLGPTDTISNQTCLLNTQCDPSIIQTSSGPAGNTDPASNLTAGIPIVTGTNTISAGKAPGGYFNRNPSNARVTASTTGHSQANVKLENYAYFANTTAISVPLNPSGSQSITQLSDLGTGTDLSTGVGEKGYTVSGDLTINLDKDNKWTIPTGTKAVIFVPGNLTIQASNADANVAAQMQKLIAVENGGFLAFIVKGDITIAANLGYNGDKTTIAGLTTPILEGVYLATGTLRVASFNPNTPSDYKFVGAGTFVGLAGVDLQRDFEDSGTRKELHNTSPTEIFQFRPDFLVNTPNVLKKSLVQWKEVN